MEDCLRVRVDLPSRVTLDEITLTRARGARAMRHRRSVNDEMSCKELVELVTRYLEQTLRPTDRVRFEVHVQDCSGCAEIIEQMRGTLTAAGGLTKEPLDADARARLIGAFREWRNGR